MRVSKTMEENSARSSSEVQVGQYWLATANGLQSWPVVICDEDMIQTFFKGHWRPPSARQPDGSWMAGFGDSGIYVVDRTFPALFLGLMRLYVC
jgi:hypothetical protein